jgi:regulator of protease activity HflC (stomatin/prohibitin superfamily)
MKSSNIAALVGIVFTLMLGFMSCTIIKPGEIGIVFNKWSGSLSTASQGITPIVPFVTTVQSYPIALRTYTMVRREGEGSSKKDDSLELPSKEGQHISQDISVTYNTSPEKAALVFKSFRGDDIEDIEKSFIRRTIITIAQNKAGQMALSDLISSKREILQASITTDLAVELGKMGFLLDKVNLGASHPPEAIEKQMQQKMAAQQQAQQADYELQKQQTLAKAKVAEAEGDAQARLINAASQAKSNSLLNETLTPLLIEQRRIDKWNGVTPTIVTSGNNATLMPLPIPK